VNFAQQNPNLQQFILFWVYNERVAYIGFRQSMPVICTKELHLLEWESAVGRGEEEVQELEAPFE
jgi:hypothetical protein